MTTEAAASGSAAPPRDPLSVLVVEDEQLVRDLVDELLAAEGYRVLTAANATEAESVATREPKLDLLLVDAGVPGGGGAPLVERLRARHPAAGAVVVSGSEEEKGLTSARGMRFLAKPFTGAQLRDAVVAALAERPPG